MITPGSPFGLDVDPSASPFFRVVSLLRPVIEKIFGLAELDRFYQQRGTIESSGNFLDDSLRILDISTEVRDQAFSRLPKSGPAVVVANHPYGGVEGIVLAAELRRKRPDVKVMANFILGRIEELREHFILVDPFGGSGASKKNLQPLREAIDWLKQGGVLAIFPSGTVSHLHLRRREVTDPAWSPTVARIIRATKAPVIPVYFKGRNGNLFQALGLIHPLLRTAMLPRELLNRRDKTIQLEVGNLIPFAHLSTFLSDEDLTAYLRLRTYILGNRGRKSKNEQAKLPPVDTTDWEPVIEPVDKDLLQKEIDSLPARQVLLESQGRVVIYAQAYQIPNTLREIGRLREISFRAVREGTGKALDLDRFDRYYSHLFVWNSEDRAIMGAYRMVKTDQVLRRMDKSGLYTSTLFNYKTEVLEQISPAIELGRSFVNPAYQRDYSALLLLWKGISHYVVRNPRHKILFGPVSINSDYDSLSRVLIVTFLQANNYIPQFARLIRAKNPLREHPLTGVDLKNTSVVVRDVREVSELLKEIESIQHSIPVLLKQYLKMGGKLLGFNIDPTFGNVLDGLIYVDMSESDIKMLERYMTRAGLESFLAFHNKLHRLSATGTEG